jgi:transcriptional regulator with XRE-family HTH domain
MTTRQLAKSVGVTQAAVVDAERTEASGDITLATLQRYAAALGCEVAELRRRPTSSLPRTHVRPDVEVGRPAAAVRQ